MAVSNSLVKKEKTFSDFMMQDAIKRKINETVGGANGQRFITSIMSAVSTNPALQECDNSSIISAAFLGEALKLSPSPQLGHYYMVPYNAKTGEKDENGQNIYVKKAQFQLGYKGYIQLMKRSGIYKKINVIAIKEGELIKYDPLSEELEVKLIEDDEIRENTATVGYYAMFEEQNGFKKTMYWSKKKMLAHADKYSQAFNANDYKKIQEGKIQQKDLWKYSSFWYKDFDGMAYKTMLRQLISKWGTMSIDMQDMQEAYTKDMAVIKENGDYEYIDSAESNIEEGQTQENTEQIPETSVSADTIINDSFSTTDENAQKFKEESTEDDFFDD